jgi:fermentation-respiration switch protein FrsA (DUF1100 family)
MDRKDITISSQGLNLAAWLYIPNATPPYPAVIMAHGFAGTRPIRLDAFAERFTQEGFLVLVFDYRHFGDSEGTPRQILDIKKQLDDWRAAIRFVQKMPEADRDRIALWGTSFAGGHVVTMAAEHPEIAACISQVPFLDGIAVAKNIPYDQTWGLTFAALKDEWRRIQGKEPHCIPVIGLPGALAAMTTPDAESGYRDLVPEGVDWVNEVAARIFLRILFYRPIQKARDVTCPFLVCIADKDHITPVKPAIEAVARAPRGELRRYPLEHFDIYIGDGFEEAVADQIEFLNRHLAK